MLTLHELYEKHAHKDFTLGSDKGTVHTYITHYERLFGLMRNDPVNLLEVGIASGHSLLLWQEYFVNGQIYGIDIEPIPDIVKHQPRIKCYKHDSTDPKIEKLFGETRFDIIIDDGCHMLDSQLATLAALYPLLGYRGIYVIEDVGSNRGLPMFKKYSVNIEVLGSLVKNDRLVVLSK